MPSVYSYTLHSLRFGFFDHRSLRGRVIRLLVDSWCSRGALVVRSWCTRGALVVHSWCTRGALVVPSWCTRGAILVQLSLVMHSKKPKNFANLSQLSPSSSLKTFSSQPSYFYRRVSKDISVF